MVYQPQLHYVRVEKNGPHSKPLKKNSKLKKLLKKSKMCPTATFKDRTPLTQLLYSVTHPSVKNWAGNPGTEAQLSTFGLSVNTSSIDTKAPWVSAVHCLRIVTTENRGIVSTVQLDLVAVVHIMRPRYSHVISFHWAT